MTKFNLIAITDITGLTGRFLIPCFRDLGYRGRFKCLVRPTSDNGAGLTVEPEKPEVLARAVEHLLTMSQDERDDMGKRGRELVEKEFSREKLAERLMEMVSC